MVPGQGLTMTTAVIASSIQGKFAKPFVYSNTLLSTCLQWYDGHGIVMTLLGLERCKIVMGISSNSKLGMRQPIQLNNLFYVSFK